MDHLSTGLLIVAAIGCAPADAGGDDVPLPDARDPRPDETFRDCRGRAFTPAPLADWRHDIVSPVVVAAGAANHMGRDPIVTASRGAMLAAKFTYGLISKDLEDEDVRVFLDDCTGWVEVGDFATDGDGQISVPLAMDLGVGAYDVTYQVLGDQSITTSTLWLLPAGTHLVVTDIDGTLTASDSELFQQMLDGSHVPVAYPGAVELTAAHHELGHVVFYMTGRPDWLTGRTRAWLRDLGFPPGLVRVTNSNTEILPTEDSVGAYKKAVLEGLRRDYLVDIAYGNASTDIFAYLGAGIPASDVWIIGSHAGERGTNGVVDSWIDRAAEVRARPVVEQPFDR
jgi:hypothetical protein